MIASWLAAPPASDPDLQRLFAGLHRDRSRSDAGPTSTTTGIDPALAGDVLLSLGGPSSLVTVMVPPVAAPFLDGHQHMRT